MLLIVFILAYGVASQALIDPYRELDWSNVATLIQDIIFLPYWQMYGELSLENIQVIDSTIDRCAQNMNFSSICTAPDLPNIRESTTITTIFLAMYLLVGNVMLLNLLIAIFTSVFDEVNENSNEVWKWEMYRLCSEYDGRPGIAPPMVLVEDIFRLIKITWKHTCRRKRENLDAYMEETVTMLRLFEKDVMDAYLVQESAKKVSSLDARLETLEKKTDSLLEMFENAPDDNANWGNVVSTEDKLYKTSSDSSDTEAEEEPEAKLRVKTPQPVSRAQTAKALRAQTEVRFELNSLKDQLERLELKRQNDMERMEAKVEANAKNIENIVREFIATLQNTNK